MTTKSNMLGASMGDEKVCNGFVLQTFIALNCVSVEVLYIYYLLANGFKMSI